MNYNNIRQIFEKEISFDEKASKILKLVSDCYGLFDMNQFTQDDENSNTRPSKMFKKEFSRYSGEKRTATLIPVIHLHSSSSLNSSVFNNSSKTISSNKKNLEAEVDTLTNILITSMGDSEKLKDLKEISSIKTIPHNTERLINSTIGGKSYPTDESSKALLKYSGTISKNECLRCRKPFNTVSPSNSIEGPLRIHFHSRCFNCYKCNCNLDMNSYFYTQKQLRCSRCFHESLEKCILCHFVINGLVIRVLGQPYHPKCFTCSTCNCSLDNKAFTVDVHERIFCLDDFHKQYAPRCDGCGQLICPQKGDTENKRIISADKTFHLQCFGAHEKN